MGSKLQTRFLTEFPVDKQLHFLWAFFTSAFLFQAVDLLVGTVIILLMIIGKEFVDGSTNTPSEHAKDTLAGFLGLCSAVALTLIGRGI